MTAPRCARLRRRAALCALLSVLAVPSWALDAPGGKVLLTVSGSVQAPNKDGHAVFDMAMLASLPQHSITTKTPWFSGPRKFTGPLLRDVLTAAGAQGKTIEAIALNDYKVTIPLEDAQQYEVVLARLLDDQPMAIRDKGPLFIIYPFDQETKLRSSIYYSRSAWQVKALAIR